MSVRASFASHTCCVSLWRKLLIVTYVWNIYFQILILLCCTKLLVVLKCVCRCHNKYPKSPSPLDDLCIKHQEWCKYFLEGTQVSKYRVGNVYCHFNPSCIKLHYPELISCQLQVPRNLNLSEAHKERLQQLLWFLYACAFVIYCTYIPLWLLYTIGVQSKLNYIILSMIIDNVVH